MTGLVEIKEFFKGIYAKYDAYVLSVVKFILAMLTFGTINSKLGFMTRLNNPFIVIIVSLLCSFLPINILVIFAGIFMTLHLVALSLEAAAVGCILILLMLVLYFCFDSRHGYALILTPLAFAFYIPCLIPVIFGLVASPLSAVAVSCGVLLYFLMHFVSGNAAAFQNGEIEGSMEKINAMVEGIIKDPEMIVTLVTVVTVLLIVYIIRKMSVNFAWTIAIISGAVTYLLIMMVGVFVLDFSTGVVSLFIGTFISAVLAVLFQMMFFNVEYAKSEYVQFEDDDYYYYVKAVPKIVSQKPAASPRRKPAAPVAKAKKRETVEKRESKIRITEEDGIISKYLDEDTQYVDNKDGR